MHTYVRTYLHTCIHAYMHTCIHTYIHNVRTYVHAYTYIYIHNTCDASNTNTHMHMLTHAHTHTCINIHTYRFCLIMHVPMQCTRIFNPSASPKDQRGYTCCLLHESPGPCGSFLVGYSLPDSFGTHLLPSSAWQLLCLLSLGATSPPALSKRSGFLFLAQQLRREKGKVKGKDFASQPAQWWWNR